MFITFHGQERDRKINYMNFLCGKCGFDGEGIPILCVVFIRFRLSPTLQNIQISEINIKSRHFYHNII